MLRQGEFDRLTKEFADVELSDKAAMIALQLAVSDAYVALGVPDKARASLGKALALDSKSLPTLLRLAEMKAAAGEFDNALAELDALLVAHGDSADAWKLKGDLLVETKSDAPGAIAAYQKALALRPGPGRTARPLDCAVFRPERPALGDSAIRGHEGSGARPSADPVLRSANSVCPSGLQAGAGNLAKAARPIA